MDTLIGVPRPRDDAPEKVTGQTRFAADPEVVPPEHVDHGPRPEDEEEDDDDEEEDPHGTTLVRSVV